MKLIDSISNQISQTLFETNAISQKEIPIYNYCLSYFLENVMYCIYILFIAFVSGQILNGLLVIITFLPLKFFAGGYHAKTQRQCYLFSYGIVPCVLFSSSHLCNTFTITWIVLYTVCSILMVCLAPIDTPNKRIAKDKKKQLKKSTFYYMIFLTFLSILLLWANCYQSYLTLSLCVCIMNGNQVLGLLANRKDKKGAQ